MFFLLNPYFHTFNYHLQCFNFAKRNSVSVSSFEVLSLIPNLFISDDWKLLKFGFILGPIMKSTKLRIIESSLTALGTQLLHWMNWIGLKKLGYKYV